MAVFKCKMCGGNLEISDGMTVCECEYCGTTQTLPKLDDEKKANLFARANRLRFGNEFDAAAGVFQSIVSEFPEEAEAYWGLCLCKYGIEYVDDPATAKKIPTCHRTSLESIFDDSNFEQACENADAVSRKVYREEAKEIDRLQRVILDIAKSESPYDIFICYKETAEDGQRTKDSVIAQDMYDALTEKGYKVFFSRITLEDKLGQEYEPYIFSALNSAKIMLAVGTDYEYFNAVWVKNEWNRFLDLMKKDKSKVLIPCYADIDAYDMPKEFKNLQGQDMGKVGFMQDLVRGINKILSSDENKEEQKSKKYSDSDVKSMIASAVSAAIKEIKKNEPLDTSRYPDFKWNDREIVGYNGKSTKVTIPYGTTAIGEKAFLECSSLESITIPDSVTSIGNLAFYNCSSLTSVAIPDSVTSIENCAFSGCSSLTSVTIPDSVTSIGYFAFDNCSSLTSITTIPDGVTSIGDLAFRNCSSLTSINVSKDNKNYCSVDGVLFNKDKTEIICYPAGKSDKSYAIPDSVTSIGHSAFSGCSKLTSITIPDSVTSIGDWAFIDCTSLTNLTIPDSVTSIGVNAFLCCKSLTDINVSEGNENYCSVEGVLFNKDKTEIVCHPIGKPDKGYAIPNSVTSIGIQAFDFCESLTSITVPNSVTSIGESAFHSCKSLTSITVPNSVTSIGESAFWGCSSLTSITIPDGVTSIGNEAFCLCSSLTSITIPDSVTSIGDGAFSCCTALTSAVLLGPAPSVFLDCSFEHLKIVYVPLKYMNDYIKAFKNVDELKNVTVKEYISVEERRRRADKERAERERAERACGT